MLTLYIGEMDLNRLAALLVELEPRDGEPQVFRDLVQRFESKLLWFIRVSLIHLSGIDHKKRRKLPLHPFDRHRSADRTFLDFPNASLDVRPGTKPAGMTAS
jgi:hypothetical protein